MELTILALCTSQQVSAKSPHKARAQFPLVCAAEGNGLSFTQVLR